MQSLHYFKVISLMLVLFFYWGHAAYSQCSPQTGPPPSNLLFNTGANGSGGVLPPAAKDRNWKVATDSINGIYDAAIVMDSLPTDYYKSVWTDCRWISISASGFHSGNRSFFYKMDFNLPCANPCGVSYNNNNSFCLSLDLLTDNSIYEIYVNGIPQSSNLGNIIPLLTDPYHAVGFNLAGMLSVSLCKDWKAGANSLIIQSISSAPVTGLLVQASSVFQQQISNFIVASICQGEVYHFGSQNLTKAGYAYDTFHTVSGCDSTVALSLLVKPAAFISIEKSICQGSSFLGHTTSGTYADTLKAANGCDSIRYLNLNVLQKPIPNLGLTAAICKGDSLLLSPGEFLSYLWQDSSTKKTFIAKKQGVYAVTVSNTCGSTTKEIIITEKECSLYFPNAFTPNGDGKNDYFKILTNYQFQEYNLIIYNRWAQKVFETSDPAKGWDGKVNERLQQTGAFTWHCRYKKNNSTNNLKGTVVLLR